MFDLRGDSDMESTFFVLDIPTGHTMSYNEYVVNAGGEVPFSSYRAHISRSDPPG